MNQSHNKKISSLVPMRMTTDRVLVPDSSTCRLWAMLCAFDDSRTVDLVGEGLEVRGQSLAKRQSRGAANHH